jgi:hypothetical protein
MHTYPTSACATVSPEEQVRHYRKKGYAGIIVTDHFFNGNCGCPRNLPWENKVKFFCEGYNRAKREGDKCDLDVFFGLECSFDGTDFLVYGLSEEFLISYENFDKLKMEDFVSVVREAGGYLAQAHPYRDAFWISNPSPVDLALMDGIEVFNSTMPDKLNKKALAFAQKHNLPKQSGSDAHCTSLRKLGGIILQHRAKNIFEIIDAIKSQRVELI